LHSPETPTARRAPLRPLVLHELWQIVGGRALWTMLLLVCPLIGYSFFQAVSLYSEASEGARQSPVLAASLSPLDGVLVPTFCAFYVAVTLLFPFVAIRVLGQEKETRALSLLVQLPYRSATLIAAKLAAVLAAWLLALLPALSALALWRVMGGHLSAPETLNLLSGHLLYGMLVGAIALFAAAVSESAATAAIVTLAFTIGSWVLDFTVAGRPGLFEWFALLSLTQTLRPFEQGLLSIGLALGIATVIAGFAALATVWLPPGVPIRTKMVRSLACVVAVAVVLAAIAHLRLAFDVSADRRNSFSLADERALAKLTAPLLITARFIPEDPRYIDLTRNVLAKLERAMPDVSIRLTGSRQSPTGDESYGEVTYDYGGRTDTSRSTSPREILPLLYDLAGVPRPEPVQEAEFFGYPLVVEPAYALPWFFAALPLLIGFGWWRSQSPPSKKLIRRLKEVSR
jgi:ABC-2 type transport system permease protein